MGSMEQPFLQLASIDVAKQTEVVRGFVLEDLRPRILGIRWV